MLALVLVALSVGLSNLAASIGLGAGGISARTRVRLLLTFGLFEAAMPIVGLLIGHGLATTIGADARWVGAALLVAVGSYGIVSFARTGGARPHPRAAPDGRTSGRREWAAVAVSGFALSLDNLIAGFALGSYHVNVALGALIFGAVSVAMSLAGLEFGARLGGWVGRSGELLGAVVLVGVGLAIGLGLLG
jgi:manganese efflux pump family protein